MRANEYLRGTLQDGTEADELAEMIEDGRLKERLDELDSHWEEVMRLAERYGFIMFAGGGVATLATNREYLRANDPKALADRLRMNDVDV